MAQRCQQFEVLLAGIEVDGSPISTGYAKFLVPGTSTAKNAWPDATKSGSAFSKLALDSDGKGVAFGDGLYDVAIYQGDPDDSGTLVDTLEDIKCDAVIGDIVTKTANYTIDPDDTVIFADTSGGGFTLSFQTVANYRHPIIIFKTDSANTLTFDPYSSETANGTSYLYSYGLYECKIFVPDTASWKVFEVRNGGGAVQITATDTITRAEHEGRVNVLAEAGGDALVTLTLPTATGSGDRYKFWVGVVNTSNYVIKVPDASHTIEGSIMGSADGGNTVNGWESTTGTSDTITLNGTTTGGAQIGDWVELVDILSNTWAVSGQITQTGTEATPFSATVS